EVAELKDNINTMIGNLRLTTEQNTDQDWLKTNLARFTTMLQGQRDLALVGQTLLQELAPLVGAHQGVVYQLRQGPDHPSLILLASYANGPPNAHPRSLQLGEGLIGQCARDGRQILISDMPDTVVPINSGIFSARPRSAIVLPILFEGQVKAVLELTSIV